MTSPRQILPKKTYLVTRRTILRHTLLRPDPQMNEIIVYLLAVTAKHHHIHVHALCAMSTHIHLVVTDERGELPDFLRFFHRMVALCTGELREWDGPVWDKSQTSAVRLETEAAVIEKIGYVLANPVAAGLVQRAHEWPGAKVLVEEIGQGALHARRPEVALNPKNPKWPAEAALPIVLPPGVDPAKAESFHQQVATEVERIEARARAELQEQGRAVLGAEPACAVPPTTRVTTPEPRISRNPTFAVGRNQGDAWDRAAALVRAFRQSYRAALEQWRDDVRDVAFPAGTWLMRVLHCAVVLDARPAG